jgi:hypothetical protein
MTGMQIKGADKLLAKLNRLPRVGGKRALRKAAQAGVTVLGKAVKREVPVRKGLLKRAETTKVSLKGLRAWAGAGADVAKLNADAQSSQGKRPTNIDWLVEFGHMTPDGTFVPPSGAMRRAESALPDAEAKFVSKLASEIEREATAK